MGKDKSLDFNNIVKRFGFPTLVERIRSTYKTECFVMESDMYERAEAFEEKLNNEIQEQNSLAENQSNIKEEEFYSRFQKIFLDYSEIFDPELYLLQLSILLERDLLVRENIRKILESRGISDYTEKFIDDIFYKDKEALSSLLQMLSRGGMKLQEGKTILQQITDMPDSNVWVPDSKKMAVQSLINGIRGRLAESDVSIVEVVNSKINITNSQVHIGNERFLDRKERDNRKKYNECLRELDFEAELKKLAPCDLKNIFRYDNLGAILSRNLYLSNDEVDNNETKLVKRDPVFNLPYFVDDVLETITSNLKYIDMDKLLLTVLHVNLDTYEDDYSQFSYEEKENLKKIASTVENLLEDKNKTVASGRVYDEISFSKMKIIIDWLDKSYVGKQFYSREDLISMAEEYIAGTRDVRTLTEHEFKQVFEFSDEETFEMLKKNSLFLGYIIENNILIDEPEGEDENYNSNHRIFDLIERQDEITLEQIQILYNNGILTKEYLLELFIDKDKISLETIQKLKSNIGEEFFEGIVNADELVKLYLVKDEEGQKEKFDKYRRLYKELVLSSKSQEEKNDISDYILDQSLELLKEERIMELYTLGLVTIDALIDYTGGYSLKSLYLSNELKPEDAKRLYYQKIITEDMLKEIMQDPSIDEGKKLTLLYSTFPEPEDTKEMRKFEHCIREVYAERSSSPSSSKTPELEESKTRAESELKKIKKAYEPRDKYRLLKTIDSEYKFRYNIPDGMGIFYFPNRDEYLIEKLYTKRNMPANGVATYILSKDVFEQNQDEIMQNGIVNIGKLYELRKGNPAQVKRFIHTGWANAIVKYYGLDDERKYSKKQIEQTKALAKQVEESKKRMEEFEK